MSDRQPRLDPMLMAVGTASFADFLATYNPGLLPGARIPQHVSFDDAVAPHGTTIVAVTFHGGVIMAGDRRATMGNYIAQRDIEKVFPADASSCIGIAGSAGIAIELVRLFQVELEHYEKIEGVTLSIEGKANRLAAMLRNNLGLAMQGLAVVPLFAGRDARRGTGRIFSYDVTGGRYEEHAFHAVGSGSVFARGSLKKLFRDDLSPADATRIALESLYDAADDDSATGGPDLARGIVPIVAQVDEAGYRRLTDGEVTEQVRSMMQARQDRPDGPVARWEAGS